MNGTADQNTGSVTCDDCGARHVAEYHHDATHGGARMFEVFCPGDGLVGYYAEERVAFPKTELSEAEVETAIADIRETGSHWLIGTDAQKSFALQVRRTAKQQGLKLRYSTGATMHGTPVITLELVES